MVYGASNKSQGVTDAGNIVGLSPTVTILELVLLFSYSGSQKYK